MVKTKSFNPDWELSEFGKNEWIPVKVPGVVQTDLYRNGVIENPLFDKNEFLLQWISEKDWVYKANFEVSDSLLQYKSVDFIFEGLDTYAGIYLNDSLVLSTDNMFLEWRIDGRKYLHKGTNSIQVIFYSPSVNGKKISDAVPYKLPTSDNVEPRVAPFVRKAAYHFGWDWSPRFLTMGIYKPVKIVAHDRVFISDLHIRTIEIADTCAWLSADVTISSDMELSNATVTVLDAFKQLRVRKGLTTAEVKFRIFHPELWWPNGYGTQTLYDLTAKLYVNAYLVDSAVTRTGIRTIELFQDDDEWGRSFYFRVNGLPIFMKGANYVPQSNFLTEVSNSDYKRLIEDAKQVGMNMLRVWGGGIYENDLFYDLCDENGILIWQDFMFAGSMYPGDQKFISSVKNEIEFQVTRLRNHPSIALWCGNNEVDVAWNYWGWQKQFNISEADSVKLYSDYKLLFEQIIPAITSKLDPMRPYTPTSPLSNWGKKENFKFGNMHYWGVWHGEEAVDSFRVNVPRFMTEYGMQSYSSYSSLKNNTADTRITMNSEFIKNRQRSYKGNGVLNNYIADYFGPARNVEDFCYLSQLNQAEAMKIAIESHRQHARYCMGSLYWQLNDVWDGASWSTLESTGKWKAAHHALKRLYAQNLLIANTLNDTTRIYFQTESTTGISGTLQVEIMDFKGRIIGNYRREVSAGYLVADQVFELPLTAILGKFKKEEILLKASVTNNYQVLVSANHLLADPVNLKLPIPILKHNIVESDSIVTINLFAEVFVKGVFLEFENAEGDFSDNYFDMLPGENRVIIFRKSIRSNEDQGKLNIKYFKKSDSN